MADTRRIDNHSHLFRSGSYAPPSPPAGVAYESPVVDGADYAEHLRAVGCSRGVLVQPSSYGIRDHRILIDALQRNPQNLRGVVCAPADISDRELDVMSGSAVVATRVQDGYPGGVPVEDIEAVADRVRDRHWHIEVWSDLRRHLSWFWNVVAGLGADVVIDHLGYIPSDERLESPVMREVIEILSLPNVWMTLSGSERLVPQGLDARSPDVQANHSAAIADRVRAFVEIAPDRVLWGTDWPHVGLSDPPTDREIVSRFAQWIPESDIRDRIAIDNNARRYRFDQDNSTDRNSSQ